MSQRRERKKSLTPEERYQRAVSAKRKFRAIVRLIIANLSWLQELEDDKLGDNVKKNIQVLTRKKEKKSLLMLKDKAVLNKPQELRTEAEKMHLRRIIGNLKCFRRYPPEVKNELPAVMYFSYYGPNRVIVKQDYEPLNMYVILSGEVMVSQTYYDKLLKEDVTKDVLLMGPGSYFGEVSLLHGIARTATVTTTQASEFLYIRRDDFDRVLKAEVAGLWAEVQLNMSWFSYFDDWTEKEIREACIMAKKKSFQPDQIILSSTMGNSDHVYFVTSGHCHLIEHMQVLNYYKKGILHYKLAKDAPVEVDPKPNSPVYKDIKKIFRRTDSTVGTKSLRPTLKPTVTKSLTPEDMGEVKMHFIKICTFNKLGTFNLGEPLNNRIIVAGVDTECLLLPQYFLFEKDLTTFKQIAHFLSRHIPSTEKVFQNFLEEKKWCRFREDMVQGILEGKKIMNNNTVHNVPYTIRLREDLGEI